MSYAEGTSVPVERSKAELERLLTKYGAEQFASGWDGDRAQIGFKMAGRLVRFVLPLPRKDDRAFTHTPARRNRRTPDETFAAWEGACRARWRALLLVVKAKLEAVASGIACFEDEFLSYIVLPGGATVGDEVRPAIADAYRSGKPAPLLLAFGGRATS
jgi:hypothetical protein